MKPNLKDQDIKELYVRYEADTSEDFKLHCKGLIESAKAPNRDILTKLQNMSKDQALLSTSNFIMKGHGYGVIK